MVFDPPKEQVRQVRQTARSARQAAHLCAERGHWFLCEMLPNRAEVLDGPLLPGQRALIQEAKAGSRLVHDANLRFERSRIVSYALHRTLRGGNGPSERDHFEAHKRTFDEVYVHRLALRVRRAPGFL